ncbi:MAG: hypothetical protein HONBIEJF_00743 [Fimbriimonadaceae bacterium]|nr:hypothetical protein [Fimbriimonadaceae bacterium]
MPALRLFAALAASCFVVMPSLAGPGDEAHLPSQAAADLLRTAARTDAAFIAAGQIKTPFDPKNLATLLQYPGDDVAIVSLKGSQIKQALERSISLYPSPSMCFLQLSGIEVTFKKDAPAESRITKVLIGGLAISEGNTYTVAMPGSLARGGMGYFKIWEKSQVKPATGLTTLESILSGKDGSGGSPRWIAQ